jgi:hypothetical protein
MTVQREVDRFKLDLVGVQEVRWEGGGTELAGEYTKYGVYCFLFGPFRRYVRRTNSSSSSISCWI